MKKISVITPKPIILGISSIVISNDEREFFQANPVFGFILFKRNIESAPQLHNLVIDLRDIYPDRQIYIFIDQEGGRVARLKPPIASKEYPTGEYFSKLYAQNGASEACKAVIDNYFELGTDIKCYGIDSPCAPVADLFFPGTDAVIGDRSFGNNPQQVIELATAAIGGLVKAGCIPVIKHIPGHGRASCDSHFELPVVKTSLEELENTDFVVFKELSKHQDITYAMTAHIVFEALDPDRAATISAKAVKYIREEIGFTGKLMTDDLSMLALHGKIGKDYHLLKKAIKSINDKVAFDLNNLQEIENFDQKICYLTENEQINHLTRLLEILELKYLKSLENVTKQAMEAGCDIILHCSGELEEMRIIAGVFSAPEYC